ncbi:hypothetical protein [Lichenibacterium ramalinae]|uniref:Uncharacterized protein n=1 Tax=Lichenibacterium ramalinae TaxID=2316527 RepID=A0A4Q2RDE3_9HYPH|nr:hypothetical protein [Lichenibacterium ramalinae]RYB05736.1 hypothetical protein D3272_09130 [Lichenibacterium ramalinae]
MVDRTDLESAICFAEGAAAAYEVIHSHLMGSTADGWKTLGIAPRPGLRVTTLSHCEQQAMDHAGQAMCEAVREVSRVFYAALEERRL